MMFSTPIVVLDFETTGLSPESGDRLTEVAALRIVGNRVIERYVSLVNCNIRIPAFISQLTGITQKMVNQAPCDRVVIPELLRFIGNDILAAHNASFDSKFLQAESARLGLVSQHQDLICSLKLSRRIFPGLASYQLTKLSDILGISFKSRAHRAEADAEVTAELLMHIGRHLHRNYSLTDLNPQIFAELNKLTLARVPKFLQSKFAQL